MLQTSESVVTQKSGKPATQFCAESLHDSRGFAPYPTRIRCPAAPVSIRTSRCCILEGVENAIDIGVRCSGNTGATPEPKAVNLNQYCSPPPPSQTSAISTNYNSSHNCPIGLDFDFHGGSTGSNPVGGTPRSWWRRPRPKVVAPRIVRSRRWKSPASFSDRRGSRRSC